MLALKQKKMNKRFIYRITHWKLLVHYLFRTKRFGHNNEWWAKEDFFLGWNFKKQFWSTLKICPIYKNYWYAKRRAYKVNAMSDKDFELAYGKTKVEYLKLYR